MDLTTFDDASRSLRMIRTHGNSGMAAGLLIALRPKMQSPAIARVAKELALRVLESSVHPDALHASGMSRVIAHTLSLALVPSGDGVVDTTRITCGTSYNPVPTYTADTVPVHGYYVGYAALYSMGIYGSEPAWCSALATHVRQWITAVFPFRKQNLIKHHRPAHETSVFGRRCSLRF